jgi:hypothetical protein
MTATITLTSELAAECGLDCVYLDGACRCHHGESDTTPFPASLEGIEPPY